MNAIMKPAPHVTEGGIEWLRIFDAILSEFSLSGDYYISRDALDTLGGEATTLFDVVDWFNGPMQSITVGETVTINEQLEVYFGYDSSKSSRTAFFVRIDIRRNRASEKEPHEMTLDEFEQQIVIVALHNHGRRWEVFLRNGSLGFADAPTRTGAAREVHRRAVNNALWANLPDAPALTVKPSLPPADILAEYPELAEQYRRALPDPA